jgi:hypothetical protein
MSMARDVLNDPKMPLAEERSTGSRARLLPPEESSRERVVVDIVLHGELAATATLGES